MEIEITKMSSRGQIVVPQDIRNEFKMQEGTLFAVLGSKDRILLKRIEVPSREKLIEDLKKIAKQGREKAEKLGIKEKDVPSLLHKARGIKE